MKIGIDYSLAVSTTRGIGRYTREIVSSLMTIDAENEYVLYAYESESLNLPSNFSFHRIKARNEISYMQISLPRQAVRDKIDVLWCPGNVFPLLLKSRIRLVVTVHDLIFLSPKKKNATIRQKIGRQYRRFVLFFGKNRIDRWLTVSQYSANDIKSQLGIKDITIAPNCIDNFYKLLTSIKKDNFERSDFYFTVSGEAPSKNLNKLIDVFGRFLPDKELYIAGVSKNASVRNRRSDKIHFLPQGIPDAELIKYYLQCKVFVFVSLWEGFGIPILEALACNANVVCSNTTSIPEVIGNFGVMVDPADEEEMADALLNAKFGMMDADEKEAHLRKFLKWENTAIIVRKCLLDI